MRPLLLLIAALAACGRVAERPAAPPPAPLGEAPCFAASLLVQIADAAGEGQVLTLRLWRRADGAARVRVHKLDVEVLDGGWQADGSFAAWLPREGVATRGGPGQPEPPMLADARWLVRELAYGPPSAPPVTLDAEGRPAARTSEGRRIAYGRWREFDGCWRPAEVRVELPDGARLAVRLKSFTPLPAISEERMQLRIPPQAPFVDAAEFGARLARAGASGP